METKHKTPLKAARTSRNLTIQDVCKITGIDVATISRLERGKQSTRPGKLSRLVRLFPELTADKILFPFEQHR